ncbi:MAG: hypothetical protein ACP5OG_05115 [Candidatus Nanoarchaeia archaeon]
MYYAENIVNGSLDKKDMKDKIKSLEKEGEIFSETSELLNILHENYL